MTKAQQYLLSSAACTNEVGCGSVAERETAEQSRQGEEREGGAAGALMKISGQCHYTNWQLGWLPGGGAA